MRKLTLEERIARLEKLIYRNVKNENARDDLDQEQADMIEDMVARGLPRSREIARHITVGDRAGEWELSIINSDTTGAGDDWDTGYTTYKIKDLANGRHRVLRHGQGDMWDPEDTFRGDKNLGAFSDIREVANAIINDNKR